MAVRVFDPTESQSTRLTVVEAAPRRRQDVRRSRHQWLLVAAVAVIVPFVAAVVVIGVAS
jgi:hypothetical protein